MKVRFLLYWAAISCPLLAYNNSAESDFYRQIQQDTVCWIQKCLGNQAQCHPVSAKVHELIQELIPCNNINKINNAIVQTQDFKKYQEWIDGLVFVDQLDIDVQEKVDLVALQLVSFERQFTSIPSLGFNIINTINGYVAKHFIPLLAQFYEQCRQLYNERDNLDSEDQKYLAQILIILAAKLAVLSERFKTNIYPALVAIIEELILLITNYASTLGISQKYFDQLKKEMENMLENYNAPERLLRKLISEFEGLEDDESIDIQSLDLLIATAQAAQHWSVMYKKDYQVLAQALKSYKNYQIDSVFDLQRELSLLV